MPAPFSLTPTQRVALLAIAFTLVAASLGFYLSWNETGAFSYALDDSYIMMAMAKNLAFNHIWGLTPYEFSSTASSPLFSVFLALVFRIFGDQILAPLLINVLVFCITVLWLAKKCETWGFKPWQTWFSLMGFIIFSPIPALIFGGMEHISHIFISLFCLIQIVDKKEDTSVFQLFFMGILLGGIRYEGLFQGGILVLYLWKEKKWLKGFLLGVGLILPMAILGAYSLQQGWFFLPNSLVLKGLLSNFMGGKGVTGFFYGVFYKATRNPHASIAILLLVMTIRESFFKVKNGKEYLVIILIISILQLIFASYGHIYRYEAYLMAMTWIFFFRTLVSNGQLPSIQAVVETMKKSRENVFLLIILLAAPMYRAVQSYSMVIRGMVNIQEQQVTISRFIGKYYDRKTIAALDIGALAYFTHCKIVDLWGLSTLETAQLKLHRNYTFAALDSVCNEKKVDLVLYYGERPKDFFWFEAGRFKIKDNKVCSDDEIEIMTLKKEQVKSVQENLQSFQKTLPPRIEITTRN